MMLTRSQIQRLAQRNQIGMQVQERDYLQHLLLYSLYLRTDQFIFKGGTALRIVYGGGRYSEDLDFNGANDPDVVQSIWSRVVEDLEHFGIIAQVRHGWVSDVGMSFDISFQGPLYDGRDHSKGKVRIDVNRRAEVVATRRELVNAPYDDVRPFVVVAITPEHLLAEKTRALIIRGKARDLYDIWLLLRQGVQLDAALIEQKLALYAHSWQPEQALTTIEQLRADWERDLRPLLPQFVPFDDVALGVTRLLR